MPILALIGGETDISVAWKHHFRAADFGLKILLYVHYKK